MQRGCITLFLLLVAAVSAAAQPGKAPNTPVFTGLGDRERAAKLRLLHGEVMDPGDKPIEKAVVYLKDKKTQKVVTVTTGKDGLYHFADLNPDQDYELYAEHEGLISNKRLLSMLDGRKDVTLNLRVENKKPPATKPDDRKSPAATGATGSTGAGSQSDKPESNKKPGDSPQS